MAEMRMTQGFLHQLSAAYIVNNMQAVANNKCLSRGIAQIIDICHLIDKQRVQWVNLFIVYLSALARLNRRFGQWLHLYRLLSQML